MIYRRIAWIAVAILLAFQSGTTTVSHDLLIMAVGGYLGWTWTDVWL